MALKTEAMGLAVAVELPLVICDIQRGGPSTGLPTKTEQADLLQALFGRNSEAPIPVLAPSTPGDCFWIAIEATRIAIKYMVPVIILSDGYLANGAEPWKIPSVEELPEIPVHFETNPRISSRTGAIRKRSRVRGPFPERRARTSHRRPREAGRHRQRELRAAEPRTNGSLRAEKVAAIVQDVPDASP
jgi:2-oxoglutarate ferredoxin oxidoreductase subunit alpha